MTKQEKRLVFATNNPFKLSEIRGIIGEQFRVADLKETGLDGDIPETGNTLEENARQKARYINEKTGRNCFADDTGLEIDALGGRPGVYSARYAGEGKNFDDNIDKVLQELEGITNRKARFRTVVCLILEGQEYLFEGIVSGVILPERRGNSGFGYDPVFLPEGQDKTFAEMTPEQKNAVSHRSVAVRKFAEFLNRQEC